MSAPRPSTFPGFKIHAQLLRHSNVFLLDFRKYGWMLRSKTPRTLLSTEALIQIVVWSHPPTSCKLIPKGKQKPPTLKKIYPEELRIVAPFGTRTPLRGGNKALSSRHVAPWNVELCRQQPSCPNKCRRDSAIRCK